MLEALENDPTSKTIDDLVSRQEVADYSNTEALANFLENRRIQSGFIIPELENLPADKRAEAYRHWDRTQALEALADQENEAEIIEMAPKMEPESATAPSSAAERYDSLIIKAETKAREYRHRLNLTLAEASRLAEIEADIKYFYAKKETALVGPKTQATNLREDLITLTKKPLTAAAGTFFAEHPPLKKIIGEKTLHLG